MFCGSMSFNLILILLQQIYTLVSLYQIELFCNMLGCVDNNSFINIMHTNTNDDEHQDQPQIRSRFPHYNTNQSSPRKQHDYIIQSLLQYNQSDYKQYNQHMTNTNNETELHNAVNNEHLASTHQHNEQLVLIRYY